MPELTQKQKVKLELLEASLGLDPSQGSRKSHIESASNSRHCASLIREEKVQYNFMLIYQILVLVFAVIVLALLVFTAWRLMNEKGVEALFAGMGALAGSAAATFLLNQRADARDAHAAAQAGLEKYQCS